MARSNDEVVQTCTLSTAALATVQPCAGAGNPCTSVSFATKGWSSAPLFVAICCSSNDRSKLFQPIRYPLQPSVVIRADDRMQVVHESARESCLDGTRLVPGLTDSVTPTDRCHVHRRERARGQAGFC